MDLGNPFEVVVYHLLIGGTIGFGYQDKFHIGSALMCVVTHWTKPTMSYDVRLLGSHDFDKLLCCIVCQP